MDFTNIKYTVGDDKWYRYKGVKPPERTPHGVSEDNIEEVIRQNNNHVCDWKQKGPYIFCTVGEFEHGKNIGVYKRLVESKDGKPILKDI